MLYAVFEDGSRQYRVSEGDVVQLDHRDAEVGARLEFSRVLLYRSDTDTQIGRPLLDGVRVLGDVVGHPSMKLYIQHFRRRKNYRRLRGHRQPYVAVQVRHILLPGLEPPAPAPSEPAAQAPPAPEAARTPPAQTPPPSGNP